MAQELPDRSVGSEQFLPLPGDLGMWIEGTDFRFGQAPVAVAA